MFDKFASSLALPGSADEILHQISLLSQYHEQAQLARWASQASSRLVLSQARRTCFRTKHDAYNLNNLCSY
jgi:hypothetical protein